MSHIFIFPCCTGLISQVNTNCVISRQDSHLCSLYTFSVCELFWHLTYDVLRFDDIFGYMPHIFISLCCTSLNTRVPICAHSRYVNISGIRYDTLWLDDIFGYMSYIFGFPTRHITHRPGFSLLHRSLATHQGCASELFSLLFIVIDNLDDQFKQW